MHLNLNNSSKYCGLSRSIGQKMSETDTQRAGESLMDLTAGGRPRETWAAATSPNEMFVYDSQNFLNGISA